jgi:cytochrome c-type biogenesis protein CcmF
MSFVFFIVDVSLTQEDVMAGSILVVISFLAALGSAYAYYQSATKKKPLAVLARRGYVVTTLGVIGASVLLMFYILSHDFSYSYVWGYSSTDLSLHLLVTTFWAGQEGSFLFWALCAAVIGLFLQSYTRQRKFEYEVMAIYTLLVAFLLLLLLVKSPFQYIWNVYPNDLTPGTAPQDGRGLNPLLQNFWMIAHPPVLFVGFAAVAVPFAFALAALWRRKYTEWIGHALPWVIFASLSLGMGIMIGGYWAYGVLGWGGWWGWDPVENSSLIPWITSIALLHTILVQKRTGNLARTNFILAIVSFVLVVYSTFLTRSGILGSASVHSFTDPGTFAYTILLIWIGTITLGGFGMLARRWRDLTPTGKVGMFTRESFISISTIVMAMSAVIILFGTSWPIFSNGSVEPSFYDKMNLPIAIVLGIILGVSLLLTWKQESLAGLLKRSSFALGASILALGLLLLLGLDNWQMAALALTSLFALFVSLDKVYRIIKEDPRWAGGAIAHVGLALLFLGIIGSGYYGKKVTTSLSENETKEVLGYQLTYTGMRATNDGKWQFLVKAERDGKAFMLTPVMYNTTYNNNLMREPDYVSLLTKDFYIEPVSLEQGSGHDHAHHMFELKRGEPAEIEGMKVTFLRFEMGQHGSDAMMSGGGLSIGAVLQVERKGKKEQITTVTKYGSDNKPQPSKVMLKDGSVGFEMLSMQVDPETKSARIQVNVVGLDDHAAEDAKPDVLVVEASLKPFMNIVWIATLFVFFGLTLSLVRRGSEVGLDHRVPPLRQERIEKKNGSRVSVEEPAEETAS